MENQIPEFMRPYMPFVVNCLLALVILIVGWIFSKWAQAVALRVMRARKLEEAIARFFSSIVQYLVLAMAFIASLDKVGVETTSVVAILGAAGLALGLALQGSLSNFASGVLILFFRPFVLKDFVEVSGKTGTIEDIGLFATTLVTPDNETVVVPNTSVTGGTITNYTKRGTRRGKVSVGVAYGADIATVISVLEKAANNSALVINDPKPAVAFVGLGASSLDFLVLTWCKSADYLDMLHNVRQQVYEELNKAGIEIPFNQIVVHNAG